MPYLFGGELTDIVAKELFASEDAGILGIEAEYESHAEHIEAVERLGGFGIDVESEKFVVDMSDYLTGFHRHFHLTVEVYVLLLHKELQSIYLFVQVLEEHRLGFAVGLLHVVDTPRAEITSHNPSGALTVGQFSGIAFGLLKGGKVRAVGLEYRLIQVFVTTFLLDENLSRGNIAVDEGGMVEMHLVLELNEVCEVLYAEDIGKEIKPELLALAFLVATVLPVVLKLLYGGHDNDFDDIGAKVRIYNQTCKSVVSNFIIMKRFPEQRSHCRAEREWDCE